MRYLLLWLASFFLLPSTAVSDDFNNGGFIYGLLKDGANKFNTEDHRIYEYGDGNNKKWNYCIHSTIAMALNIRLGQEKVTLETTHSTFDKFFGDYGNHDKRLASLSYARQLSYENGEIPDVNATLRTITYGDGDALYKKIKDAIKINNPVVVAVDRYDPVDGSGKTTKEKKFSAVSKFKYNNVGHGLLITGYLELDSKKSDNNLIMVRDPFIEKPLKSSIYKHLYDYTISIKVLKDIIKNSKGSYHLMLFKTKLDADLKILARAPMIGPKEPKPGDICGNGKVFDCKITCVSSSIAKEWQKDNYCDDGSYSSSGVFYNLNCPAFNNDGGKCN